VPVNLHVVPSSYIFISKYGPLGTALGLGMSAQSKLTALTFSYVGLSGIIKLSTDPLNLLRESISNLDVFILSINLYCIYSGD
jgi:hypothetical protein